MRFYMPSTVHIASTLQELLNLMMPSTFAPKTADNKALQHMPTGAARDMKQQPLVCAGSAMRSD